MNPDTPTTLGPYQIIREIARSNDIVYEAYDPTMNRRVALKELSVPRGATPQQQEERANRFRREAQAVGSLSHPNIMTVYAFGEDAGRSFMAMEYLDGHTLRNELDTKGFLPTDRAVEIARDILRGLQHAHDKGVIHRDIKPDNVQILSDGTIKITDFGIARLTFQPNLTMDGQVFGTPSYMSPEQVVGRDIDARSDLFSVGVVLYEMLSGQKPFPGDNVVAITHAIMNVQPPMPPQIPFGLWTIVERLLDKSPQLRPSSAAETLAALEAYARSSQQVVFDPSPMAFGQPAPTMMGGPVPPPILTGTAIPPPPVAYPYNPYAATPVSMPPPPPIVAGPGMPPPIPVYYPPPPRKPLLKPETRLFLTKLFVAVVLIGTFVGLLMGVGIWIANTISEMRQAPQDASRVEAIRRIDPTLPPAEQVNRAEEIAGAIATPKGQTQAERAIADRQRAEAQKSRASGDNLAADMQVADANARDGGNPNSLSDEAEALIRIAQNEPEAKTRATAFREAASRYRRAAQIATDSDSRDIFAERAINALFAYIDAGRQANVPRNELRAAVYEIEELAGDRLPDAKNQARQLGNELRQ